MRREEGTGDVHACMCVCVHACGPFIPFFPPVSGCLPSPTHPLCSSAFLKECRCARAWFLTVRFAKSSTKSSQSTICATSECSRWRIVLFSRLYPPRDSSHEQFLSIEGCYEECLAWLAGGGTFDIYSLSSRPDEREGDGMTCVSYRSRSTTLYTRETFCS